MARSPCGSRSAANHATVFEDWRALCDIDLEAELQGLLAQIPPGRVTTYGLLAQALGSSTAARWVGEYLRDHEHRADCTCHRVLRKEGGLGRYLRGHDAREKGEKLKAEGIEVRSHTVADLPARLFNEFASSSPLTRLISWQAEAATRIRFSPCIREPQYVAGLDVSYGKGKVAWGGCAIVEVATGERVWSMTVRRDVTLPYIPGFLTFRELPLLMELFAAAQTHDPRPDLYLVDGNGVLHPRGAGIAACFGAVADVPTIGVAKSLLCGRVEGDRVLVSDRWAGVVDRTGKPLYVSTGQDIDPATAATIVATLHCGHRLPEPLYWADRLSRIDARRAQDDS